MIKAVLFDVDGVLLDSFEANLKFYQDLFPKAGYKPPTRETFLNMFYMSMIDVIRVLTNSKDENEIKRIWQMGKNRVVRYPDELSSCPANLETVLNKLRKKYILGIVTSRVGGNLFKLPQLAKYEPYFKTAVYYEDTIKHKPDPEPLLLAVKRLDIKPEETIYIGDAATDVQAAKAAGMKIIIYSKNKLDGADAITSSIDKLADLIEGLN